MKQDKLNAIYDNYVSKYGIVSSKQNALAFRDDSDYPLLCSLEDLDEVGTARKADMFTKQTIRPQIEITEVDTAMEALAVCLNEKGQVDLRYMTSIYDSTPESLTQELKGQIFLNPEKATQNALDGWETADEYLSGDVRRKQKVAKLYADINPEKYSGNAIALESVQPKDLDASEIDVKLGATWVESATYEQFLYELLRTPSYNQNDRSSNRFYSNNRSINVNYNNYTGSWSIENKSLDYNSIAATQTYGTKRMDAYTIIEETLNLRSVTVKDRVEDEKHYNSCVFVGYDANGEARYASIRGTSPSMQYRKDVTGSDKSYPFSVNVRSTNVCSDSNFSSTNLFVFESPIDLMSYLSLLKPYRVKEFDAYCISLGGVCEVALERFLYEHAEINQITLGLDNDEAGCFACEQIRQKYSDKYIVQRHIPENKDFNEDLINFSVAKHVQVIDTENKKALISGNPSDNEMLLSQ